MARITIKHKNKGAPSEITYVFEVIGCLDLPSALKLITMDGKPASMVMVSGSAYRAAIEAASRV